MCIWIRSQNKKLLNNCNNLQVIQNVDDNTFYIVESKNMDDHYFLLGSYFSEEKAIKVLDMIQKFIKSRINEDMVFQMPNDEEVGI